VRELLRLLGEAGELEDDGARRRHLVGGARSRFGALIVTLGVDDDFGAGRRGRMIDVAVDSDADVSGLLHTLRTHGGSADPGYGEAMVRGPHSEDDSFAFCRKELLAGRDPGRRDLIRDHMTAFRVDDASYAGVMIGCARMFGGVMSRAARDRRWTDEDRALHELFVIAARPLWRRRAPIRARELYPGLPPRLCSVLRLFLDGLAEKEVADRLQLSPATVHSYARDLYRELGVTSRAELLVKALGNGRRQR
jgi:DNA-binding CsgD family transcriptional regulator